MRWVRKHLETARHRLVEPQCERLNEIRRATGVPMVQVVQCVNERRVYGVLKLQEAFLIIT